MENKRPFDLFRNLQISPSTTGVIAGIVLLAVILTATQPSFATWGNFTNLISANSVTLVLAVGMTFVLLAGGIDLSVTAAAAATGIVFGSLLRAGADAFTAISLTLLVGIILGLINGVLISYAKISFLVVTLGTSSIFASLALILSDGSTINTFEYPGFGLVYEVVQGRVMGIPLLLFFDIALIAVAVFVLRSTAFGRSMYAVGSNEEAARLNGINVERTRLFVFTIAGFAAGLASLIQVGRVSGAAPTFDFNALLVVFAAVLIGGTSYKGGEGSVMGTVLGVIFLGMIQNGLTLSGIPSFWQGAVNGTVLILAVSLGVAKSEGWFTNTRSAAKKGKKEVAHV